MEGGEPFVGMAEYREYTKRIDDWQKRQDTRLREAEEKIDRITMINGNIERLTVSMNAMCKEQERQGQRLTALERKDGELWQTVVKYAITAAIGIVVGFLFTQMGM